MICQLIDWQNHGRNIVAKLIFDHNDGYDESATHTSWLDRIRPEKINCALH